jgi:23S rRNA pseudouridine1911/1915/1917 synthase
MTEQPVFQLYEYKADPKQEPMRIDKFLMDRIESITRSKVQAGIEEGWVLVNGRAVKSNYKVKPHDQIVVRWHKPRSNDTIEAQDIPLDIRYEDEHILVINKPAGLVVHPGVGVQDGTLVNALMHYLQWTDLAFEANDRPGIVHRIDKNTTGLLLIAKTPEAMSILAKQFFHHTVERRYRALVWGNLEQDSGTITANIGRHPQHRKLRHVFADGSEGKHAVTHYRVLQRFGYVTYVECKLETGRTHQIRVHFKHLGHPLFGDPEYGGDKIVKGTVFTKYKQFVENCLEIMPAQALHAMSLGFVHPSTGQWLQLESELPANFQELLNKWEKYTEGRKL